MKQIDWAADTPSDLVHIMNYINSLSMLGLFDQLDFIVSIIPYTTATPTSMICILRSTYKVKSMLPAWQSMVILIYHELKNRGYDADKIMQGLL